MNTKPCDLGFGTPGRKTVLLRPRWGFKVGSKGRIDRWGWMRLKGAPAMRVLLGDEGSLFEYRKDTTT